MRLLQETPMTSPSRWLLVPILLAALSACGGDEADDASRRDTAASGPVSDLPAPEGAVGSVTGMPEHPGPGTVPLASTGTGPTVPAPTTTATGTGTGTGTGIVTGTARTDAVVAIDDGGLDRMAVATDFPEPTSGSAHVAPIIIISEPDRTAPSMPDTPLPTDAARDDDAD